MIGEELFALMYRDGEHAHVYDAFKRRSDAENRASELRRQGQYVWIERQDKRDIRPGSPVR